MACDHWRRAIEPLAQTFGPPPEKERRLQVYACARGVSSGRNQKPAGGGGLVFGGDRVGTLN